ncbi:MAG: hypothetical protein U0237_00005 [Thermoleophilia bacterium]
MCHEPAPDPRAPSRYRIQLAGHLDDRWSVRLDAIALVRLPDGTTAIDVQPVDQAALHGLLGRVRDAGLRLISVAPITPDAR